MITLNVSTLVSFQASFPISLAPRLATDEYNPVILVNLLYIHIIIFVCIVKVPEIIITRYGVVMIISTYISYAFVFRCLSDRSQKRKIVEVCLALHKHLKVLIKYDAFFLCHHFCFIVAFVHLF